ncbi:hypothetical protein scyTo_0014379 [Scyliorhinus torazame]|uniref:Uncharacterized protein n=1 Tax=Scyliorhinus torazame TaxID=75743 RepID=A0A401NLM1_SCYTO|nr:hypothetical protein [Scyliorhinus torazame]
MKSCLGGEVAWIGNIICCGERICTVEKGFVLWIWSGRKLAGVEGFEDWRKSGYFRNFVVTRAAGGVWWRDCCLYKVGSTVTVEDALHLGNYPEQIKYGLTTPSVFTNVSKVQCLLQREEIESGTHQLGCNGTRLHHKTL